MERENWIQDILNSTNGITKVKPNDDLFARIETRIQDEIVVPTYTKWLVAASICLLISLNFAALKNEIKQQETTNLSELVTIQNNQLY